MAACAGFPGEPGDEPGVPDGPVAVPTVRRERDLHRYVMCVRAVRRFNHQVGVPEAAVDVPGQTVPCHVAQVPGTEGPDELQAHVGRHVLGILDGPGPGEVPLEGAGVALYAAHARLEVGGPCALLLYERVELLVLCALLLYERVELLVLCALLLYERVELDRELQQVLAQYLGPDGVPPLGVVPERLEEIVLAVDGRHAANYTLFSSGWIAQSVAVTVQDWFKPE